MQKWFEKEFRPFRLTDDGQFYQAVGTKENPERIEAVEIIKALDEIAINQRTGDNTVKGVRISQSIIVGNLNIEDCQNLIVGRTAKSSTEQILLPYITLDFFDTTFDGYVSFQRAYFLEGINFNGSRFEDIAAFNFVHFGEFVSFRDAQFKKGADFSFSRFGEYVFFSGASFEGITNFSGSQFESQFVYFHFTSIDIPAGFADIKYWHDSAKVTLIRWFWKVGIRDQLAKHLLFLPNSCPEGKPPAPVYVTPNYKREGVQFYFESHHISEITNPHFRRYVADHQFIRDFEWNHRVLAFLWRWSSDYGRSFGLWALWSGWIVMVFSCAYAQLRWAFVFLIAVVLLVTGTRYVLYAQKSKFSNESFRRKFARCLLGVVITSGLLILT